MITRNEKLWLLFIYSLLSLIILGSTYLHHFQPHILRVPDNTDLASWTRPAFENTEIYRHATEEERTKLLSEGIPDGDRILFQFLTIDLIMILAGWFWFRHAKKHYGYWMASAFLVGSFIFTGLEESMWILLGRFIPQTITTPLGDVVYGTYWFTKGALWFIGTPVFNCLGWFIIAYPCVHFTGKLFPKLKLGSRAALGGLVAVIGIDSWMDPLYTSSEFMFWVWAQYDIITIFGIPHSNFIGWFLLIFLFAIFWGNIPRFEQRWGRAKATVIFYSCLFSAEIGIFLFGIVWFFLLGNFLDLIGVQTSLHIRGY